MIEIGPGITIEAGIVIGNKPVFVTINDFVTQDDNFLVSETGDNFIEEN